MSEIQGPVGPNDKKIEDQHILEEGERQYTYSISEEDRQKSFEIEDERWSKENQRRDWMKLGLMILINWAWCLLVFLLEPGLR